MTTFDDASVRNTLLITCASLGLFPRSPGPSVYSISLNKCMHCGQHTSMGVTLFGVVQRELTPPWTAKLATPSLHSIIFSALLELSATTSLRLSQQGRRHTSITPCVASASVREVARGQACPKGGAARGLRLLLRLISQSLHQRHGNELPSMVSSCC